MVAEAVSRRAAGEWIYGAAGTGEVTSGPTVHVEGFPQRVADKVSPNNPVMPCTQVGTPRSHGKAMELSNIRRPTESPARRDPA